MRNALILLFIGVLQAHAIDTYSQKTRLSLNFSETELVKVLDKIEDESEFFFLYNEKLLDTERKVDITANDQLINMILDNLFAGTDVKYTIIDRKIILAPDYLTEAPQPQKFKVSGTITDSKGEAIPGVNVILKGTVIGVITDIAGKYTINVPDGNGTLVFSFIGYTNQEIAINGSSSIDVKLSEELTLLNDVVVTALGIKRETKSIGYAIASIDNSQITASRATNIGNNLVGKVAGVNVSIPTTGPGGSSKIRIRGQSSFSANNSPLIVVNGTPINNIAYGAGPGLNPTKGNSSSDGGDGLQSINPDDIESMTVLKGAVAAALYGYRAKDGAIIITTKAGSMQKGIAIEWNFNTQVSTALDYTDYQYEYGQGENGIRPTSTADAQSSGVWSFGEKFDGVPTPQFDGTLQPYSPAKNRVKDFYRAALSTTNSIAVSSTNNLGNFRLSFANTDANDIVPNSYYDKKIFNVSIDSKITQKLSALINANYSNEYNHNPSQVGTEFLSIPTTLATMANSIDVKWLEKSYEDINGNEMPLSRFSARSNPYWVTNKHFENVRRDRLFGNMSLRYQFNEWLYAMARIGQDYYTRSNDYNSPTGSRPTQTAITGFNGTYYQDESTFRELNMDFLVSAKHSFGNFGVDLTIGGNKMDQINTVLYTSVTNFYVRDLYTIGNGQTKNPGYSYGEKEVNSLYGIGVLSFKNLLFFNITARNDWFSTLNPKSNNYLYPSASASFVFSDALANKPKWLSFGKLRVAYAEVGADTDPYTNALYYSINANQLNGIGLGNISSAINPNTALRPLKVKEAEVGMTLATFNSRINFDFSLYRKNTIDEILNVNISQASGYNQTKVNIGRLRNSGLEMLLTLIPVERDVTWETGFNGAYNISKVLELSGGSTVYDVGNGMFFGYVSYELGKPLCSVRAFDYKRDSEGRILTSGGKPLLGDLKTFGSGIPKWTGSWINTITYKGFRVFTQLDFKADFVLLSNGNFNGLRHGLTKQSLPGREGGVIFDGYNLDGTPNTTAVPAEVYYSSLRGLGEPFISKGDFVRWRTLSVGYDLGQIVKKDIIKGITVSFYINNVLMIKKYQDNYDPESQFAVSDNVQGLEVQSLPTTRSYGLNLNVKF